MTHINTALIPSDNNSTSFESRITHYLMKDCYEKVVEEFGMDEAKVRMNKAWVLIEKKMTQCKLKEPVLAVGILFEESNNNQQLHTLYYATIFWRNNRHGEI